jgi:RNA polymerase sigma factor (sigma-70 family)
MAKAELQGLIRRMCRNLGIPGAERISDAQLLERFVTQRDQAAFEVLVWRHGSMVLSVCNRVLRDGHLAEDAFQGAFLTLARKAETIGQRASLAGWLYRVAYRIALRARAGTSKRAAREQLGLDLPVLATHESFDEISHRDLQRVLDEELNQLPSRYRVPLVLCYLEGLTNEEAARQLGCPKGTIATRLARARDRLRSRLHRRGVAMSALSLGAVLLESARPATVSAALVNATTKAAAMTAIRGAATHSTVVSTTSGGTRVLASSSRAEKALSARSSVRRAVSPAVLAVLLFAGITLAAGGAGVVAYHGGFGAASRSHCSGGGCHPTPATPVQPGEDALAGHWLLVEIESTGGVPFPALRPGQKVETAAGKLLFQENGAAFELPYELGPIPWSIDLCPLQGTRKGDRIPGLYQLDSGRLTVCCDLAPGAPRPLAVQPGSASKLILAFERRPGP